MKPVFIYALKCPLTGQIRYVGKSNNPNRRFLNHFSSAIKGRSHRACWIRSLNTQGLQPVLEIIDEVPDAEWPQWEVAYIEFFREQGCDLVNSSDGGEGLTNPSAATRAKQRAAKLGITGEKHPFFGRRHTPAANEKNRLAHLGKRHTSVSLTKMRNTRLSKTDEECAAIGLKQSRGMLNKKHSQNTSGFAGIIWDGPRNKYRAEISWRGRRVWSARFSKIEDAVFARALALDKYCDDCLVAAPVEKRQKLSSSGFVGIYKHVEGKWHARLSKSGRNTHVGLFAKIEDAVFARALAVALQ